MPTVADFEKSMLALAMWYEDGPDGLQGMVAIGLVLANRVRAGWSGGDWCAVLEGQTDNCTMPWPDTRDPKFQAVLAKADKIYDGTEPDITGGALYYKNLSGEVGPWFTVNIMQRPGDHPRLGTVGQRTFFG